MSLLMTLSSEIFFTCFQFGGAVDEDFRNWLGVIPNIDLKDLVK